jgi:hypothetical protein
MSSTSILGTFCAVLLGSLPLQAQISVAICAAENGTNACEFQDVQAKLMATGQFTSVGLIDVMQSTPTLLQLQQYQAVIVWSNYDFQDATLLGTTLADYVDAGGGVVVSVFANCETLTTRVLGGRWLSGYEVIPSFGGIEYTTGPNGLGNVLSPGHPVMNGVTSFDGGIAAFRPQSTSLTAGATLIAQWSDGKTLVAEGANPKRIDLGFYPPSDGCAAGWWWLASTDGDLLMANALSHVANSGCPQATSYCTSSTTSHGCSPALGASGTPSAAAASGFTITCTSVEGQKSGLLFYGISGEVAVPWAAGSTSFLCVKTPTQRTPSHNSGGTTGACDGQLSIDLLAYFTANPTALGTPFAAGGQYRVQAWFRDPPAPKTTNLSNGLAFAMCP